MSVPKIWKQTRRQIAAVPVLVSYVSTGDLEHTLGAYQRYIFFVRGNEVAYAGSKQLSLVVAYPSTGQRIAAYTGQYRTPKEKQDTITGNATLSARERGALQTKRCQYRTSRRNAGARYATARCVLEIIYSRQVIQLPDIW
eukprot:3769602-Rhodomonas_salina.1